MPSSSAEKKIAVINVYDYLLKEQNRWKNYLASLVNQTARNQITEVFRTVMGKDALPDKPQEKTALMTGVHRSSVHEWHKQQHTRDSLEPIKPPGRPEKVKPQWVNSAIVNIVQSMYGHIGASTEVRRYPTVANVREQLYTIYEADDDALPGEGALPTVQDSTFRKWIKDAGFSFKRIKGEQHTILVSRFLHASDRIKFLRAFYKYQDQGKVFIWTDETWVNRYHQASHGWILDPFLKDGSVNPKVHGLNEGLAAGMHLPSGKGARLIILHFMTEEKMIKDCALIFKGVKSSNADYHDEMDGERFESHCRAIADKLPKNSVIIMDKASYHNRYTTETRTPTKKADLINFLIKHGYEVTDYVRTLTNPELKSLAKGLKIDKEYTVDQIFAEKGIEVLRLPTKHCEYNPIELIWAFVKKKVAKENVRKESLERVQALVERAFDDVTPELTKNCVRHAMELMQRDFDAELKFDQEVEPLIIRTGDDDSDDEDEEVVTASVSAENPEEKEALKALMRCSNDATGMKEAGVKTCSCKKTDCKNCKCAKDGRKCSPKCKCNANTCRNKEDRFEREQGVRMVLAPFQPSTASSSNPNFLLPSNYEQVIADPPGPSLSPDLNLPGPSRQIPDPSDSPRQPKRARGADVVCETESASVPGIVIQNAYIPPWSIEAIHTVKIED